MEIKNHKGKTITFYSYKGGVGRSMALVNIGCLLAKNGYKVLLMDWDLEAPGLNTFFSNSLKPQKEGLIDFFTLSNSVNIFVKDAGINQYNTFFKNNLSNYIQKEIKPNKSEITLDLMSSGKSDKKYSSRLNKINWIGFYKKHPVFFRTFAQFLEQHYDYILIDARTGLADTSGICTMLMPKILVTVFSLNKQNIDGVVKVAKQSLDYRFSSNDDRDLTILPLPSRIDSDNPVELQKWYDIYKNDFEKLFKDAYLLDSCDLSNYFDSIAIPYKSDYAYGENIPVLEENINNKLLISYSYNQFFDILKNGQTIWDIKKYNIQQAMEYNNIGVEIFDLARKENNEKLFHDSIDKFNRAIENNPYSYSAYFNLGNVYCYLEKYDEGLKNYSKAINIIPNDVNVTNNMGVALYKLAQIKKNEQLFQESEEKLLKALELGAGYYNLFCLYAIWDKKELALQNLEKVLINKEEKIETILKDEDWQKHKNDKDYVKLIEKYSSSELILNNP